MVLSPVPDILGTTQITEHVCGLYECPPVTIYMYTLSAWTSRLMLTVATTTWRYDGGYNLNLKTASFCGHKCY